jgi:hypothetical protein
VDSDAHFSGSLVINDRSIIATILGASNEDQRCVGVSIACFRTGQVYIDPGDEVTITPDGPGEACSILEHDLAPPGAAAATPETLSPESLPGTTTLVEKG